MNRRNRRNHHTIPHLPPRPKKPLTGYSLFLRTYFENQENDGEERNLGAAAATWKAFTPEQRNAFTARVAQEKGQYEREITAWKQLKKSLQKPPTAYGLFIRQRWDEIRRAGGTHRDVAQVGQAASRDWATMAAEDKRLFYDARRHMMTKYREHIGQLGNGGTIQQNWMTQAFEETELYRVQQEQATRAARAAVAEAEEIDESDDDDDDVDFLVA